MKISMVSEHASPLAALGGVDAGGQNVHVAELSRALAARGHSVTVFTRRDDPHLPEVVEADGGVTVVHVDAGPPVAVPKDELLPHMTELGLGIAAHWRAHPARRPDLVHSHFWMSGLAAGTALRSAGLDAVPLLHTFHALGTVKRRHQGVLDTSPPERTALEPHVGREADRIIATCSDEVDELAAMGLDRDRVSVVPCGVDLRLFDPEGEAEETGGKRRIVCVGRLVPRKGVDLVVHALAALTAEGFEDVELHVVGGGAEEACLHTDPEARRLRDLAQDLGVADRVVLRGQVPREEMPAILRSARLVACTPWYEPFGIVPLEAMACGVPVVAARVGGLQDTVVPERTGLHVEPHDPASLAAAAARLLSDPQLARRLGAAGTERVRAGYSWATVAARTEEVYAEVRGRAVARGGAGGLGGHLDGTERALASLRDQVPTLQAWGRDLAAALSGGARLLTAGNGGSAAEAQHLSSELVGRFRGDRPAYAALALSTDPSAVTAISNDYGYEEVFARQVEAHARPGDVLVLLTTSGRSPNLLRAVEAARRSGARTWALTGPGPNPLSAACDSAVCVDAPAPHVQEAHLTAVHALCTVFDAEVAASALPHSAPDTVPVAAPVPVRAHPGERVPS
ncbi:hypothetical protein GCM10009823_06130 [Brevibacterium salitolerans]|uniref:SIS domain-containing protein n=1 Tax=Brevibacterium salitolerans TaxID=1403566 RepID=A0ABN2WDJ9_9MICO